MSTASACSIVRWRRAFRPATLRRYVWRRPNRSMVIGYGRALIKAAARPYSKICLSDHSLDGQSYIQVAVRHDSSALGGPRNCGWRSA